MIKLKYSNRTVIVLQQSKVLITYLKDYSCFHFYNIHFIATTLQLAMKHKRDYSTFCTQLSMDQCSLLRS